MGTTAPASTEQRVAQNTGHRPPRWVSPVVLVLGSLALGAATSWAQGALPDSLTSFANSVSGWTICTALLVVVLRPSVVGGALGGPVSFVCLTLGYTFASQVRGLTYDPTFWAVIGLLAGPFVGAAAATLRGDVPRWQTALGSGLLAGVLTADGLYGLTVVAYSTSPVYWTLALVAAGVLMLVVGVLRLRAVTPAALQLGAWLATSSALTLALRVLS